MADAALDPTATGIPAPDLPRRRSEGRGRPAGLRARLRPGLLALALAALPSACADDGRASVEVFAAASLSGAFAELATAFEARHPDLRVDLHTAGSETLVAQLLEGAHADLLFSADEACLAPLRAAGRLADEPTPFAANRLVVAVATGNPHGVRGLADLAREDLAAALCGPGVPAGRYAREACAAAGVTPRSLSDEPSVSALVHKLLLGELDVGVVYATDVRARGERLEALPVPEGLGVRPRYPGVALAGARHPEAARRLRAFVSSPEGRAILARHGFLAP